MLWFLHYAQNISSHSASPAYGLFGFGVAILPCNIIDETHTTPHPSPNGANFLDVSREVERASHACRATCLAIQQHPATPGPTPTVGVEFRSYQKPQNQTANISWKAGD